MKTTIFFSIFILLVNGPSYANSCSSLLTIDNSQNSKSAIIRNLVVSNVRFPQVNIGIRMSLVSLILREEITNFSWSLGKVEVNNLVEATIRFHDAKNIDAEVTPERVERLFTAFKRNAPKIQFQLVELLAANLPSEHNPLKIPSLVNHFAHSPGLDYSSLYSGLYQAQTQKGKEYLLRIGETMHGFLWSRKIKVLSNDWRAFLAGKRDGSYFAEAYHPATEFRERFSEAFSSYMILHHPEFAEFAYLHDSKVSPEYFHLGFERDMVMVQNFAQSIFKIISQFE